MAFDAFPQVCPELRPEWRRGKGAAERLQVQQFVSAMVTDTDNGQSFTDTPGDTSTETVAPSTPVSPGGSTGTPTTSPSTDPSSGDGVITANGIPCVN